MNTTKKTTFYLGWLLVLLALAGRVFHYLDLNQSFPYLFGFALVITAQQQYIKRLKQDRTGPQTPTL